MNIAATAELDTLLRLWAMANRTPDPDLTRTVVEAVRKTPDVNAPLSHGMSPLETACSFMPNEAGAQAALELVFQALLENGAKPFEPFSRFSTRCGETRIDTLDFWEHAFKSGCDTLCAALVRHPDFPPVALWAKQAQQRLVDAARLDRTQTLDALLQAGVAPDGLPLRGTRTALFEAASPMAVAALKRAGASMGVVDEDGATALECWRRERGAEEAAALMGAWLGTATSPEETITLQTCLAMRQNDLEGVRQGLAAGALPYEIAMAGLLQALSKSKHRPAQINLAGVIAAVESAPKADWVAGVCKLALDISDLEGGPPPRLHRQRQILSGRAVALNLKDRDRWVLELGAAHRRAGEWEPDILWHAAADFSERQICLGGVCDAIGLGLVMDPNAPQGAVLRKSELANHLRKSIHILGNQWDRLQRERSLDMEFSVALSAPGTPEGWCVLGQVLLNIDRETHERLARAVLETAATNLEREPSALGTDPELTAWTVALGHSWPSGGARLDAARLAGGIDAARQAKERRHRL